MAAPCGLTCLVNDYTALFVCIIISCTYFGGVLGWVCVCVCVLGARLLNFDRAHNSQIWKWRIICNTLGRHLKVSAAAAAAASLLLFGTHSQSRSPQSQSPSQSPSQSQLQSDNQLHTGSSHTP